MERLNLKKLWKIAKNSNTPLLGTSTDLSTLDFMEEYLTKYEAFDRGIALERGFFQPIWNIEEEDTDVEVFEQWQKDVYYFLLKNKENYTRLYNLLSIEYDPLTNYDKTSQIMDVEGGSDMDTTVIGARHREEDYAQKTLTDNYGAISETDVIGEKQNTKVNGAQSTTDSFGAVVVTDVNAQQQNEKVYGATSATDNIGAVSNTDNIGARSDTLNKGSTQLTDAYGAVSQTDTHGAKNTNTTEKLAGFNSADFSNSSLSDTQEGTYNDSHSELARTDTHSTLATTDTNNIGAQSNSHSENARVNSHSETTHTDTETLGSHTDSHTTDTHSDTHSSQSYTDTETQGEQTNTHGETARVDSHVDSSHKDVFDDRTATDTLTTSYGHTTTHNEHTTGNIGVTTSQQMAQSEIDLWNSFRFYEIMFSDIVKNLCTYYDSGYEPY